MIKSKRSMDPLGRISLKNTKKYIIMALMCDGLWHVSIDN